MTSLNIAQKLLKAHLVEGSLRAGTPITLKIEQTLTQDATGTLVMLALEAMDVDRVATEVSVQYVDPQPPTDRQSEWRRPSFP